MLVEDPSGFHFESLLDGKNSYLIRNIIKNNISDILQKINSEIKFNCKQRLLLYGHSFVEQSQLKSSSWLNYIKILRLNKNI